MTDFSLLVQPDRGEPALLLKLVTPEGLAGWLASQPESVRILVRAQGFTAKAGTLAMIGDQPHALIGLGRDGAADPWILAAAAERLAEGRYRLDREGDERKEKDQDGAANWLTGWMIAQHRFDRYRASPEEDAVRGPRVLFTQAVARIDEAVAEARAIAQVRDLVNMPANDMGPEALELAMRALADRHGGQMAVIRGDDLETGFPLVHAVGMAADRTRAPRLLTLKWGNAKPAITIIGKGVCFDTGGLDIKPSSGMRLMKKDMGGAAHALALAGLVMDGQLPVTVHLIVPAVENAIGPGAMRPGDVFSSRKGLKVEITNTDAEGRLILADALTLAGESRPDLILDFATLTGAARVALGPDLPALFANEDTLADDLLAAGRDSQDLLWRLPLHAGYADMLKSDIADLANAADTGFAGAIAAALFLEKFVEPGLAWAHVDTFAWAPGARPGRPKGGAALGVIAAWRMLKARYEKKQLDTRRPA